MANHPNRSKPLPPLAASLKAYRAREGDRRGLGKSLPVTVLADELGVPVATLHDMEQRARSPMTHLAAITAWALDRL